MQADEIRFLFAYDRWATRRVLTVLHEAQHRAEASALLTAERRSPGELDLMNNVEEQAASGSRA